jgi:hypothetical protein
MAENSNWNDMMEANSKAMPGAKLGAKLHHVEIVHHMSDGEMRSHSFQKGEAKEMASHMASCPHCSSITATGEGAVKPDAESAAGAAS